MVSSQLIPIALDAMGGDSGPASTVPAAAQAVEKGGLAIALVGDPDAVQSELEKIDSPAKKLLRIVPSKGVVGEDELPAESVRSKPRASVFVSAGLVKAGKVKGFVSMGSTGASIAAATVAYGTLPGIDRGALGGPVIGYSPNTVIIDLGTNVDTRPSRLADFAAMGAVMAQVILNIPTPSVALLSVGTEANKGNQQVKQTADLLRSSGLNFIGNIEGNDLINCKANVVICDGFVGNIILKLTESLGKTIAEEAETAISDRAEAAHLKRGIIEKTNPLVTSYGGGPLLGVKGVAIVGHGSATISSIANAILTARRIVVSDFLEAQAKALEQIRKTYSG